MAALICFKLLMQAVRFAMPLAAVNAGNNNAARIPMMAMTTSNSTSVKALSDFIVSFMFAVLEQTAVKTTGIKISMFVRLVGPDCQPPF